MFTIRYEGESTHLLHGVLASLAQDETWLVEVTLGDERTKHIGNPVALVNRKPQESRVPTHVQIQPTDDSGELIEGAERVDVDIDAITELVIP